MTVPSAYFMSTKNTAQIFDAMQRAAVPDHFTYEFLKQLGFPSSGDRPTIPVLKALTFLDQSGAPTALYRKFKDKSLAPTAIAEGMRVAYSDVFAVDTEAHTKTPTQVAGIFGRLSDKGEAVNVKMASTFKFLSGLADFDSNSSVTTSASDGPDLIMSDPREPAGVGVSMHHDIHLHLPISTDVAVYDAIFKSLRANLL